MLLNLIIFQTMYCNVPACQITTYYYVGFAYVMMRRYADAIRTYQNSLLYVQRMRQMFQAKSYQNDQVIESTQPEIFWLGYFTSIGLFANFYSDFFILQVNKQTEQMYTMLAVCLVLHPQSIDESITNQLAVSSVI